MIKTISPGIYKILTDIQTFVYPIYLIYTIYMNENRENMSKKSHGVCIFQKTEINDYSLHQQLSLPSYGISHPCTYVQLKVSDSHLYL